MLAPFLDVEASFFCLAGAKDSAPCRKWVKREGFVAVAKRMAGMGRLKKIWKDAFHVAGAIEETCSSKMLGGQRANFLRGFAFWSIWSSGCVAAGLTFSWHVQYFRQMEWTHCKTNWYEAVSTALIFPFSKEVWQTCFVFDVFQLQKLRKSRRLASFLMLPTSKIEEVSQNCFFFDVAKFKSWGSLAELLRFLCCQVQKLRKSRRIAPFSRLELDR